MNWTFLIVYAHIVGAIVFVGYFLFWALTTAATWREFPGDKAYDLLQTARDATWPLPGLNPRIYLIGWLLLAFVVVSGVAVIVLGNSVPGSFQPDVIHGLRGVKLLLTVALAFCMRWLGASRPPLAWFSLILALLTVLVSSELIR